MPRFTRNSIARCARLGNQLPRSSSSKGGPCVFREMNSQIYVNRDAPDYQFNYAHPYTERQLKILDGTIPYQTVRLTDLYALMKKAEQLNDYENAELAERMYNEVKYPPDTYKPATSYEEALDFLENNENVF